MTFPKLSPLMERVLSKMESNKVYTSYELGANLKTMRALYARGLVTYKAEVGGIWFPRTSIMWKKRGTE